MQWLRQKFASILDEGKRVALRETLKWIFLTIVSLVGGWFSAALHRLFAPAPPLASESILTRMAAIAHDFARAPLQYSFEILWENFFSTILTIILVACLAILFVLWRRIRRILGDVAVESALTVQAGLGGRWNHAIEELTDGAPWKDLCAEISRPDNNMLLIVAANGLETFAKAGSPLYEPLRKFRHQVRVLLLDPDCSETEARALTVSVPLNEYKRATNTSIRRLDELIAEGRPVTWRLYTHQPSWKMIITSRTAFIQYYISGQHVQQTPLWRLDVTEHGTGFYHSFVMEFERLWREK